MDWVPVQGFPGYSVHPDGHVRRDQNSRLLHIKVNQYGVPYVGLMRKGEQRQRSLALLVAKAFVEKAKATFDVPINLNGDRCDCAVENLTWRPRWFAVHFNRQFRERYESPIEAPIKALEDREVLPGSLAVSMRYGLLEKDVVLSIMNRTYAWPTYQQFVIVD